MCHPLTLMIRLIYVKVDEANEGTHLTSAITIVLPSCWRPLQRATVSTPPSRLCSGTRGASRAPAPPSAL
jgi:hypothetical protein